MNLRTQVYLATMYETPVGGVAMLVDAQGDVLRIFQAAHAAAATAQALREPLLELCHDPAPAKAQATITNAMMQMREYFAGMRDNLVLPFRFTSGTDLQRAVWKIMSQIPAGETLSYADVAREIGYPKAHRAVGSACGKNPLPLLVPCHRIVASNGLGGFGWGLDVKRWLLARETQSAQKSA